MAPVLINIRIIASWGLYQGPPIYGNYHLYLFRGLYMALQACPQLRGLTTSCMTSYLEPSIPERNYKPPPNCKIQPAKTQNSCTSTTGQYYYWLRRLEFQLTVPDTPNYGGSGSHRRQVGGRGGFLMMRLTL